MIRRVHMLVVALLTACVPAVASAAPRVLVSLSSQSVYVGDQIRMSVRLQDAPRDAEPKLPDMSAFDVVSMGGSSQFRMTTNLGRMQRVSFVEFNYILTPRRAGTFNIPPITIESQGKTYASDPITVEVLEPSKQDIVYMELSTPKKEYWIDEPFKVQLQIWIRKVTENGEVLPRISPMYSGDPPGLTVPWLCDLEGCETEDLNEFARRYDYSRTAPGFSINNISDNGFFLSDRGLVRFQFYHESVQREGLNGEMGDYVLYTMSQEFTPTAPGLLDIAPVRFKGKIPLEVRTQRRGGGETIVPVRDETVVVLSNALQVLVKDPPADGRPDSYTGAIGAVSLDVDAKPTDVAVGDPITLQVRISGRARLENVGPPPLATNVELTKSFRVPEDPTAGVVSGNTKVFTQSIRPTTDQVTEIPPIEMSYFDTKLGRYVTLESEPIPIHVRPSEQLSLDAVVGAAPASAEHAINQTTSGLQANDQNPDKLLSTQSASLGPAWVAAAAASPLGYAVLLLIQTQRSRLRRDVALARRRKALRSARGRLSEAKHADTPTASAQLVSAGMLGYLADRFNLPAGGLTKDEAMDRLNDNAIGADTVDAVETLLTDCEAAAFAGSAVGADSYIERAERCIADLERVRLS